MTYERLFIESEHDFEDGATIVVRDGGLMTISVAQELAVGSYNQDFECTIRMSAQQARELRDWLVRAVK